MKRFIACVLILCLFSALNGCTTAGSKPPVEIGPLLAESEAPFDYSGHDCPDEADYVTKLLDWDRLGDGRVHLVEQVDAASWRYEFSGMVRDETFGYDLRFRDAREADLSVVEDWNTLSFGSDTVWPDALPEGFSPEDILEYNKNPGLSVRDLHRQGYTGKGVGIAIVDQALYAGHEEYAENLKAYEMIHCSDTFAVMHGPAVASIAVGKTVGVAPEADLYYIASTFGHYTDDGYVFDASIMADCILRVLEINDHLSQESRIRVISISKGYRNVDPGYAALQNAIRQADEQGVFVVTPASTAAYPAFALAGLSRNYFDDPDDPASYRPVPWDLTGDYSSPNIVCVPMGSRAYASCTGPRNYEISYQGGMSWAVPWMAGFYALCCQAKPNLTSAEFIEAVTGTTRTYAPPDTGKVNIIDPAAVIARLTAG